MFRSPTHQVFVHPLQIKMSIDNLIASKIYSEIHYVIRQDIDSMYIKNQTHAFGDKKYASRIKFEFSNTDPNIFVLYEFDSGKIMYEKGKGYILEVIDWSGKHTLCTPSWPRVVSFVDAHFAIKQS